MSDNDIPSWAAVEPGRSMLLADRGRLLDCLPQMRLQLRQGQLLWAGQIEVGDLRGVLELHYPDDFPAAPRQAKLVANADGLAVTVKLVLRGDVDIREQMFLLLRRVGMLHRRRAKAGAPSAAS